MGQKTDDELINDEATELTEIEKKSRKMLNKILNKEIVVPSSDDPSKERTVKIGSVLDPDKHIWYSRDSVRPIINEEGFDVLVELTGAEFPSYKIIEKQSDFANPVNSQVWIEAVVKFPNGEVNTEYGIANNINCSDKISKANMPIMALKRARSRAFFRSKTIDLFVYDESEMRDSIVSEIKKKDEEILKLKREIEEKDKELETSQRKLKTLFNNVARSIKYKGKLIWKEDDLRVLNEWLNESSGIENYLIRSRIRFINRSVSDNGKLTTNLNKSSEENKK